MIKLKAEHAAAHAEIILAECARRQLKVFARGAAYRICGKGVDLLVHDLSVLTTADLQPKPPIEHDRI